jgi:uncharacterized membrane protein
MVIFLALMVVGVVLAARYLTAPPPASDNPTVGLPSGVEEVLAHRYAHGEIDDDEGRWRFEMLHQDG